MRQATRTAGRAHDEHRLMAGFTRREPEALEEIFARFGSAVYAIGVRRFGEGEAAEAFTERAFVSLWHRAPRYRWSSLPLETWVLCQALAIALQTSRTSERAVEDAIERRNDVMPNPLWLQQVVVDEAVRETKARHRHAPEGSRRRRSARRGVGALFATALLRARESLARSREVERVTLDRVEAGCVSPCDGVA
jgi:DNA-directed RNA polymerase specialized sigma24 family protein